MNYVVKGKRRTVNGAPKLDRKGNANPKFKATRTLKTYNYHSGDIHDKNAMTVIYYKI